MFLLPMDETEIFNTIRYLTNRRAVGLDEIQADILSSIAVDTATPLTHIINLPFEKDVFPTVLKHAIVQKNYKRGLLCIILYLISLANH